MRGLVRREPTRPPRFRNYTWAELMKRVLAIDVLQCPCGGTRRLIAMITLDDVILRILRCLGVVDAISERGPPAEATSRTTIPPELSRDDVRLVLE
jgi:hypothetical protein